MTTVRASAVAILLILKAYLNSLKSNNDGQGRTAQLSPWDTSGLPPPVSSDKYFNTKGNDNYVYFSVDPPISISCLMLLTFSVFCTL